MAGMTEGHRKTLLIGLAVLLGLLLALVFLVWPALEWYLRPVFDSEADLSITQRRNLVQGLASVAQALAVFLTGTVGLIGLYFTWRNLRQTQEQTEQQLQQARESAQETLRLTEQRQITERFTRAIELLGSDHLGIRLGAIYALERIARDSERDHWPIMEVLTNYVRSNAPRDDSAPHATRPAESEQANRAAIIVPDPDVQAIMTVLRRRSRYYGNGENEPLDLFATDLTAIDLREAHLERADLSFSFLRGTDLAGSHLEEAKLIRTDLEEANLRGAFLHGADLRAAAGLTQEEIEMTYGNWKTKFPEGINRPASWAERPQEQPNGDE